MTLKDGITWSDGTPLSSADVVTTFNVGYLLNLAVWEGLDRVEAVDDRTVRFVFSEPSFAAERQIMVEPIRADSVTASSASGRRRSSAKASPARTRRLRRS